MFGRDTVHAFTNIGQVSGGRAFPGFPARNGTRQVRLEPRGAVRLDLKAGDLVSLDGKAGGVQVVAFGANGTDALADLALPGRVRLDRECFDAEILDAWIAAQGGDPVCELKAAAIGEAPELAVLAAKDDCTAWFCRPATRDGLTLGEASGAVTLSHQSKAQADALLPPPLGDVRDEFTVERGTALSYEVRKGEIVQIIDVDGQQCSDFQAGRIASLAQDDAHFIDSTATRSMVRRAYPGPGLFDKFFDGGLAPLMRVVQDTCGRHDTFGMACSARGYEERGFPGHVNCSDNISDALEHYGIRRRVAWPAINFFWNTWVEPTHHLQTEESHSRPGDYVALAALDDLLCVSTACPDDIDPINGWNPTDIHVRIYRPEAKIQRAVGYREKEDAPMLISEESAFHPRLSAMTQQFAPARDLWAPVTFPSVGTLGEYWACREAVTLQDMSGLRKFDIVGPDAEKLLQQALTRDVAKLAVWRGVYALICDTSGAVIDDGTLFRLGPQLFRWCCGTEQSGRAFERLIEKHGWQVRINDMRNALPNLALQGPKSRELLKKLVFTQPHVPSLEDLKWFGVTVARIGNRDGPPFMLARSGYTGELGYEIFCAKADALAIWDAIMEAGTEFGIKPMGSQALEMIRIEAGFAAAGAEFAPGVDAHEAGLGFAVDMRKAEFEGRAALARNSASPRRKLKGLLLDCDDVPHSGTPVFSEERQVGEVTSATRSPSLERGIAIARLAVEFADNETVLAVGQLDGHMKRLSATVADIPFIDPKRERARA